MKVWMSRCLMQMVTSELSVLCFLTPPAAVTSRFNSVATAHLLKRRDVPARLGV
jgi:hypothetical protein